MLTGLELGYVVRTIEAHCPKAIEVGQKKVNGKMEIVVDEILSNNAALFAKLSEYAEQKASQRQHKVVHKTPVIIDISNRRKRKR